jgi:amidase
LSFAVKAKRAQAKLYDSVAAFFANHDCLLCPVAIVPPFDVDIRYVDEVDGQCFDNDGHWISITFAIKLTSCPAA